MFRRGKRFGYLTPDAPTDDLLCRSFSIPNDPRWLGNFMGALYDLTLEENWRAYGDLTPEQAADAYRDIFDDGYFGAAPCAMVDAPYWVEDSADDADDQAPQAMQPWYGQVAIIDDRLTFTDNLGIWLIAGFIAYAGLPSAAIAFVAPARNFVLQFQKFSLGGVVKAFIDLVEVGQVDTYSADDGVVEMTIYNAPTSMSFRALTDDPPQLLLVLQEDANPAVVGTPAMRVIRKRLDQNEVYPIDILYDPDCDCVKKDWGGSVGVVDYPQGDPRHSVVFLRPARTEDIKCGSAANMVDWIRNFINQVVAALTAAAGILFIVSLLFDDLSLISEGFTLFLGEGTELASDLAGAGSLLIDEAFDSETYALLLCIFFCRMDAAGNVSADALGFIETDVTAQINTTAALVINAILAIQGEVGLTNAGRIGSATADCDDCGCIWCYEFDFTLTDGGFTAALGAWTDGVGWQAGVLNGGAGNSYTYLEMQSPGLTGTFEITEVRWTFDLTVGTFDLPITDRQWANSSSVPDWYATANAADAISPWVIDPALMSPSLIGVTLASGYLAHAVTQSGNVVATKLRVYGVGDNPFGDTNC